jgi:hypothetical protein
MAIDVKFSAVNASGVANEPNHITHFNQLIIKTNSMTTIYLTGVIVAFFLMIRIKEVNIPTAMLLSLTSWGCVVVRVSEIIFD